MKKELKMENMKLEVLRQTIDLIFRIPPFSVKYLDF
jgi:hypothetical protein